MGNRQKPANSQTADDSQRLRHELHVHKIELEEQNTELRSSWQELESSLQKYSDLYEFSPFGYFTLDSIGDITAANLCGAELLGVAPPQLIGRRFMLFLVAEDRPVFVTFLRKVFTSLSSETCDVTLQIEGKLAMIVQLKAKFIQEGECHLALIDITERKRTEESLRRYAQRLIVLDEEMRKKFAADLHDELAQYLTALGLNLSIISNGLSGECRKKLGDRINLSSCLIEEMGRNIREMMAGLRPPVLDKFGLVAALRWYADLFTKRTGVDVDFTWEEIEPRLADGIETAFFRIVQEALSNITKHAAATSVKLRINRSEGRVRLSISDNGRGFLTKTKKLPDPVSGWGLTLMRERAESVGARLFLDSIPGQGTMIEVEIGEDV